ncbi:MAG: arylamine N-acetyltransferase [Acidobacteriota bacterium]
MDVAPYLQRIGDRGSLEPTLETLRRLHLAHLRTVPFENLDISLGRPIDLSLPALFGKIVTRRRGGFCYELNGLFCSLLRELGFRLDLLSGRVFGQRGLGPEHDHALLLVHLEESFIADVGFGDSFLTPVPLSTDAHVEGDRAYRFVETDGHRDLQQRTDGDWASQVRFTLEPRELDDFAATCRHHQTSPESTFTRKSTCSRATETGRVTYSDGRLIVTEGGERTETALADADAVRSALKEHFGVVLPGDTDHARLFPKATT